MKTIRFVKYSLSGVLLTLAIALHGSGRLSPWTQTRQAESCRFDQQRVNVIQREGFHGKSGVGLQETAGDNSSPEIKNPDSDLTFTFDIPRDGLYHLKTTAVVDDYGSQLMKAARNKYDSLFIKIRIAGNRPTMRVVYVPWRNPHVCVSDLGIFELAAGKQNIRIDLPRGVLLDQLTVEEYRKPLIPPDAENYRLPFQVPPRHPRLLMNPRLLARLKEQIKHPENAPHWEKVCLLAQSPCRRKFDPGNEVGYEADFLNTLRCKALFYLITGNRTVGREAVGMAKNYLSCVEFGNLLDITRENGETIFTGSLVYDWCYELLSDEDKNVLRKNLLRLARSMECGWPPFKNYITVGHGNEAQINRDLLSMAVAVYDEDPIPLKYCSFQVFERLLPLRQFEYRSPRHSQGLSYAAFRFRWEMYAAIIFKRMLETDLFPDNFKKMGYYWIYMQTPLGIFFREGDGISWSRKPISAPVMLLCSSYAGDPILKKAFLSAGNRNSVSPFDFLLFNDTGLPENAANTTLPRGFDFGPVYPGISTRTNWDVGSNSQAAAAIASGGGFHSGNHQHSDSGSFQIAYRGHIISPLTIYRFYGTPYDLNFNKRSVSRSMLLIYDPEEKFSDGKLNNDGGSRFIAAMPFTLDMLTRGEIPDDRKHVSYPRNIRQELAAGTCFHYGEKLAAAFFPDIQAPVFSIYSANLKGAYSGKVLDLVRTFAFIDLGKSDTPAVAVVYDQLHKKSPELTAFWQVTTLVKPEISGNDLILTSFRQDNGPRGKMLLQLIKPPADKRKLEILTGDDVHNVFGTQYSPPIKTLPEANGSRVMFRALETSAQQEFLSTMSLYARESKPVPVNVTEFPDHYIVAAADRALVLVKGIGTARKNLRIKLPEKGISQIAVHNLHPGTWQLISEGKKIKTQVVDPEELTLYLTGNISDLQLILQK